MKKYKVIAKTKPGSDPADVKKWNVTDLLKFTEFLDKSYGGWCWFNVFEYTRDGSGQQIASFTNRSRPTSRFVAIG